MSTIHTASAQGTSHRATVIDGKALWRAAGRAGFRYGSFGVVLVLWGVASWYLDVTGAPSFVLPPPTSVVAEFFSSVRRGTLPAYYEASIVHLIGAGAFGLAAGILMGLLIGLNRWIAKFFYPLLNFFQSLGGIALAPLLIIWFGYSGVALIIIVDYTIFFPIAFNTLTGVRSVPPVLVNAARTMGAGRLQIIRDVLIPGALPNILLGIRLALAYGWRALIAVEMLFLLDGLGFMIFDAQQFLNTPQILLGMLVLGVTWLLISEVILRPLEDLTIGRWGMVQR